MVSFGCKMNFPHNKQKSIRFIDDVLKINDQSCCILSRPCTMYCITTFGTFKNVKDFFFFFFFANSTVVWQYYWNKWHTHKDTYVVSQGNLEPLNSQDLVLSWHLEAHMHCKKYMYFTGEILQNLRVNGYLILDAVIPWSSSLRKLYWDGLGSCVIWECHGVVYNTKSNVCT